MKNSPQSYDDVNVNAIKLREEKTTEIKKFKIQIYFDISFYRFRYEMKVPQVHLPFS